LTFEERQRITDTVVEANGGRTPVLVGTSVPSTEESVQLSRYVQQAGAEAVFVKPPGVAAPAAPGVLALAYLSAGGREGLSEAPRGF
jgi:4-hydroxy-tetrahydrodipicolinate synthase